MRNVRARAAAAALAFVLGLAASASANETASEKKPTRYTRGWLEHAIVEPIGLKVDAKLDTGAKTSSIHAEILRYPGEVDPVEDEMENEADELTTGDVDPVLADAAADVGAGASVRLESAAFADEASPDETIIFRLTNEDGESRVLQRRIVDYVNIKTRDGGAQRRPVVHMDFCIAGVLVDGDVNLTDRSNFNYPLLVGRNMLEEGRILVDSRKIYTRRARCEPREE